MLKLLRLILVLGLLLSLLLPVLPVAGSDAAIPPGLISDNVSLTGGPGQPNLDYAPDHILVKFKASTALASIQSVHAQLGVSVAGEIPEIGVQIVNVPAGAALQTLTAYLNEPSVEYAEPDYLVQVIGTPSDSGFSQQWGLTKIQAPAAWDVTTGSSSVKIAVLDTGIDQDHEDLAAKIVANQNFSDSTTVDDLYGHGTHVAGIAAAITNNGVGVAGAGYNSSLMNVKVLGDSGSGLYSWVASGIIWAADNGAKVINMSLGGGSPSPTLEDAINYAWSRGVVLVAAAGNNGDSAHRYPAYYTNIISVAATSQNDAKASWSTYGTWVDVAAPGVSIYSTLPNHPNNLGLNYGYLDGTSMAAPFVSGLAALVWTTNYGTSNADVRSKIEGRADPIAGTGTYWQYGRINAYSSVHSGIPAVTTGSAAILSTTSATLSGNLTSLDTDTSVQVSFDYGTSLSFGSSTSNQTLTNPGSFSANVTGLDPSTTYYFRAKAVGSGGTASGGTNFFYTPPYAIVASAGTGGTISPSGTIMVGYGDNQTFTFAASSDYHLANTLIDGVSIGAAGSYTFTNVTAPHTISARFAFGQLRGWGYNGYGQLGDGTTTDAMLPIETTDLRLVSAVSAGVIHSLALTPDGHVWAWGWNLFGQVGDSTGVDRHNPVQVPGLSGVTEISAGYDFSMALKSDGTVWTWGFADGIGDGSRVHRFSPVQVHGPNNVGYLTDIVAISGGGMHALALKSDGTVWAWGWNAMYGEIGDGTLIVRTTPVQTIGLNNVIAISAGGMFNLALKSDGTVWAWGQGDYGEMGNGTNLSANPLPVQVSGLTNVIAISAGSLHGMALKSDGTVWTWGSNEHSELGDGTSVGWRLTPVQISLTGVVSIETGVYYSLAMKSDGTVWAWGFNEHGQLGNGTTANSNTPVQFSGLNGIVALSGGHGHTLALEGSRLTVAKTGSGNVTPSIGSHTYAIGEVVSINATAAANWEFVNWTGDNVTTIADINSASTNITINGDYSITANFNRVASDLILAVNGNGTVAPSVGSYTYAIGEVVSINATAATNWAFVNWTGDVSAVADVNSANTTITMNDDYSITANFVRVAGTLTLAVSGSGNVTPSAGSYTYPVGTSVNITATPDSGWKFDGWTGGNVTTIANVNSANTTITINGDYNITAIFGQARLAIGMSGSGNVTPSVGIYTYPVGTVVSINASAAAGWGFGRWSGHNLTTIADINSASTNITMNDDYMITAVFNLVPDLEWSQTYGGSRGDVANSLKQTNDGGYIIVGRSDSFGTGEFDFDVWLVKTDASGNLTWSQTFGGTGSEDAFSVQQTNDGGYIVAGYTDSYGAGNRDVWLVKTNSSGNLTWSQTFGGIGWDEAHSVQQTSEGGYIIAGETSSYGAGSDDVWLIKTNASGNLTWSRTFGGISMDFASSVRQTADGGYILTGSTYIGAMGDVWLLKTDSSGNLIWGTTFGGTDNDLGRSVWLTADGGYIIAATIGNIGGGGNDGDFCLIKTDASGNITWDKTFGGNSRDWAESIQQTSEGGYIVIGLTASYGGVEDLWLIKTDSVGNKQWSQTFGGSSYDGGYSVQQTSDGGYVAAGYTIVGDNDDFWLLKLDGAVLNTAVNGSGAVTQSSATHGYSIGTSANITATAATNWEFVNWTGDNATIASTTSANTSITMNNDYSITANFNRIASTLTMAVNGSGTVTPSTGSYTYAVGTSVNITATAAAGWQFSGWSGAVGSSNSDSTNVTMGTDKTVTANFSQIPVINSSGGGGGGGGGGTTVVSGVMAGNNFIYPATATSTDQKVVVDIPKGTVANTVNGRLNAITILVQTNLPDTLQQSWPEYSQSVGVIYNVQPDGTTFDPPINLTIKYDKYDEKTIPGGVDEKNLAIASYDMKTGTWSVLESTNDPENNTVSALISHFSLYTIIARNAPASFTISDLQITPQEALAGENITASVAVTNAGDLSGSCKVDLKIDGKVTQTKEITLGGRETQTVTFNIATREAGTHDVSVGDLAGTFGVIAPKTPPSFTTSNLLVTPDKVKAGEMVSISVIIANAGETDGTYQVVFRVNEKEIETKDALLAGLTSDNIVFTAVGDEPGTYAININGLAGSFLVEKEPSVVTEQAVNTETPPAVEETQPPVIKAKPNWWIIGSWTVGSLLIITGTVIYLSKRKKHSA